MKIVITGGEGFIGKYVQSRLRELGIETATFDPVNVNGGGVAQDVRNYGSIQRGFTNFFTGSNPDAVIHLAGMLGTHELWETSDKAIDVNIKGGLNVGQWCVENDVKMVSIEQPHIWYNVYEASKLAVRRMLTGLHYDRGLRIDFVTAHNAFGPGQHHGDGHPRKIIPTFATQAWAGGPIEMWRDGTQEVNLVYAGDVADALVARALDPNSHPLANYQAGNDTLHTVRIIAEYVSARIGGVEIVTIGDRPGEQSRFDYPQPDYTYPYKFDRQKLDATIDWYRP